MAVPLLTSDVNNHGRALCVMEVKVNPSGQNEFLWSVDWSKDPLGVTKILAEAQAQAEGEVGVARERWG